MPIFEDEFTYWPISFLLVISKIAHTKTEILTKKFVRRAMPLD